MKTKLLHRLRVKAAKGLTIDERLSYSNMTLFLVYKNGKLILREECFPDEYDKVKKMVFSRCDEFMRNDILRNLKRYK